MPEPTRLHLWPRRHWQELRRRGCDPAWMQEGAGSAGTDESPWACPPWRWSAHPAPVSRPAGRMPGCSLGHGPAPLATEGQLPGEYSDYGWRHTAGSVLATGAEVPNRRLPGTAELLPGRACLPLRLAAHRWTVAPPSRFRAASHRRPPRISRNAAAPCSDFPSMFGLCFNRRRMKQGCPADPAALRESLTPDPDNAGVGSFMA